MTSLQTIFVKMNYLPSQYCNVRRLGECSPQTSYNQLLNLVPFARSTPVQTSPFFEVSQLQSTPKFQSCNSRSLSSSSAFSSPQLFLTSERRSWTNIQQYEDLCHLSPKISQLSSAYPHIWTNFQRHCQAWRNIYLGTEGPPSISPPLLSSSYQSTSATPPSFHSGFTSPSSLEPSVSYKIGSSSKDRSRRQSSHFYCQSPSNDSNRNFTSLLWNHSPQSSPKALNLSSDSQKIKSKPKISASSAPQMVSNVNSMNSFVCSECPKSYRSRGALKMHERTHMPPFECLECGKRFSRRWLLTGHSRTHSGDRPFSCSICDRAFADKSNLRAHQKTHVMASETDPK